MMFDGFKCYDTVCPDGMFIDATDNTKCVSSCTLISKDGKSCMSKCGTNEYVYTEDNEQKVCKDNCSDQLKPAKDWAADNNVCVKACPILSEDRTYCEISCTGTTNYTYEEDSTQKICSKDCSDKYLPEKDTNNSCLNKCPHFVDEGNQCLASCNGKADKATYNNYV